MAPMPGFSGFGSSMMVSTMYCGSSIGNARQEGVEALVAGIAAVDDLLGRAGLAADAEAGTWAP